MSRLPGRENGMWRSVVLGLALAWCATVSAASMAEVRALIDVYLRPGLRKITNENFEKLKKVDAGFTRTIPYLDERINKVLSGNLGDEEFFLLYQAADLCRRIGSNAEPLVPELGRILFLKIHHYDFEDNYDAPLSSATALGAIGEAGIPLLIKALESGQVPLRVKALFGLREAGPAARPAIGNIIKALNEPGLPAQTPLGPTVKIIQGAAINALGAIQSGDPQVVATLLDILKSSVEIETRRSVLIAFTRIGYPARAAREPLTPWLKDPDMSTRYRAAQAIFLFDGHDAQNVGDLIAALEKGETPLRMFAADALGKLGAKAAPANSHLIARLKDEDLWVRRFSAQAIGDIRVSNSQTVAALVGALNDPAPEVREWAVESLGKLDPLPPEARAAMEKLLKDPNRTVAWRAARARFRGQYTKQDINIP